MSEFSHCMLCPTSLLPHSLHHYSMQKIILNVRTPAYHQAKHWRVLIPCLNGLGLTGMYALDINNSFIIFSPYSDIISLSNVKHSIYSFLSMAKGVSSYSGQIKAMDLMHATFLILQSDSSMDASTIPKAQKFIATHWGVVPMEAYVRVMYTAVAV